MCVCAFDGKDDDYDYDQSNAMVAEQMCLNLIKSDFILTFLVCTLRSNKALQTTPNQYSISMCLNKFKCDRGFQERWSCIKAKATESKLNGNENVTRNRKRTNNKPIQKLFDAFVHANLLSL